MLNLSCRHCRPHVGSWMRWYQCGGLALCQYRRPYDYDSHARTKAWTCCQKETGTFRSNKKAPSPVWRLGFMVMKNHTRLKAGFYSYEKLFWVFIPSSKTTILFNEIVPAWKTWWYQKILPLSKLGSLRYLGIFDRRGSIWYHRPMFQELKWSKLRFHRWMIKWCISVNAWRYNLEDLWIFAI